MVTVNTC